MPRRIHMKQINNEIIKGNTHTRKKKKKRNVEVSQKRKHFIAEFSSKTIKDKKKKCYIFKLLT